VAVINKGDILLVEDKIRLMTRMGQKEITLQLTAPLHAIPGSLASYNLAHGTEPDQMVYAYDTWVDRIGIRRLLNDLDAAGLVLRDVQTRQRSLEDIFVGLVRGNAS